MSYKPRYPDGGYEAFVFTADKTRLNLEYLYNMLCIPSRYSSGLPLERFPLVIENSFCFGVFLHNKQVGFARVISDSSEFSSIWDVFIDEEYRRKGLGQALLKYIFAHPRLCGTFRWFLMTEDAHTFYHKFGFKSEVYNSYIMMMVNST